MTCAHHAFLDEELGILQSPGHILTQPAPFFLTQHLGVEVTNLQTPKEKKDLPRKPIYCAFNAEIVKKKGKERCYVTSAPT